MFKDRKSFGKMLAAARQRVGLSQAEVAEKLGYTSPQFISNIERGITVFPEAKTKPYAKLLGLSPNMVLKSIYRIKLHRATEKYL